MILKLAIYNYALLKNEPWSHVIYTLPRENKYSQMVRITAYNQAFKLAETHYSIFEIPPHF
jgi:hypothetical protein